MYLEHLETEIAHAKAGLEAYLYDRVRDAHFSTMLDTKRALAFIEGM